MSEEPLDGVGHAWDTLEFDDAGFWVQDVNLGFATNPEGAAQLAAKRDELRAAGWRTRTIRCVVTAEDPEAELEQTG
jgi:hypothetical protein